MVDNVTQKIDRNGFEDGITNEEMLRYNMDRTKRKYADQDKPKGTPG